MIDHWYSAMLFFFEIPKLRLPKFGSDQSDSVGSCYTEIDFPYLHLDGFISHFFRNLIDLSGRLMLHGSHTRIVEIMGSWMAD